MKFFKNFLLLSFIVGGATLLTVFSNCTKEKVVAANPVCFEADVLPIFIANCTQSRCHNSIDHDHGYDLTDYASIVKRGIKAGDFKNSEIYQSLVTSSNRMPVGLTLTSNQIQTIAQWIEEGANNTTCAGGSCDTTVVTYSGTIKPLLDVYCTNCHGVDPSNGGGIDLTTWDNVKSFVDGGSFLGDVRQESGYNPMPKGGAKLSDCNISKIEAWINRGAKND